ncbi:hypothetical protein J809_0819 [Acinetobacter sp. 25977_6]|nr:hypothetical protein J809_0819 [Acinetobacter sp. 25977_6]
MGQYHHWFSWFFMNWYFAKKKNKRDEIALKAYLESLEKKGDCNVKQD